MDQLIGKVLFVDGANRPVFLQPDGRQYVLDDDGERVHGVWILLEEKSVVPDAVIFNEE